MVTVSARGEKEKRFISGANSNTLERETYYIALGTAYHLRRK